MKIQIKTMGGYPMQEGENDLILRRIRNIFSPYYIVIEVEEKSLRNLPKVMHENKF